MNKIYITYSQAIACFTTHNVHFRYHFSAELNVFSELFTLDEAMPITFTLVPPTLYTYLSFINNCFCL